MCPDTGLDLPVSAQPLVGILSFQNFLILIGGILTVVSCSMSFYQVFRHATNYTKPGEQRQIIRICLLVPVYSISALLSIAFHKKHAYLNGVHLLYEAFALVAFYALCCEYVETDRTEHAVSWDQNGLKKWFFTRPFAACFPALGGAHYTHQKPNQGWKRFNRIWFCIYQYPFVKLLVTIASYVTEANGMLCSEDGGPKYADFWLNKVVTIATLAVAMNCLFQFYYQSQELLSPHKPVLKFLAIKIVVFLVLVQGFILDAVIGREDQPLGPTDRISYTSLEIGIPNLILCLEMFGVGVLHLFAYPWSPYVATATAVPTPTATSVATSGKPGAEGIRILVGVLRRDARCQGGLLGWRAYVDALNFSDFALAFYRGAFLLFKRQPETTQDTSH
ncbi:DUF300 domain-containing protein [Colletotrichum truncatum]|uniref:DUF300 domain-containing protein n=1 Tax=Colletotrichum truncatum TaxID=5467 RepID=A0ACC3ZL11_COLTU|nr:duf300 domain-containing protein [Colletotrichum truncatum]KAF6786909.1 duf300 domain-containing protein [Colletotrichum truncatum]